MARGTGPIARLIETINDLPEKFGRPATATAYVPQIDGLRFIAILSVLLWHSSLRADRFVEKLNRAALVHADSCRHNCDIPDLYGWFPHGEIGVALFFFISGYIITQPFLARPKSQWNVRSFYMRRLRRIYPPYLVALTLCLAIIVFSSYSPGTRSVSIFSSYLASAFYADGILFNQPSLLDPPMWSLDIEAQFYLIAPILLALYLAPHRIGHRLLIGCVAIIGAISLAGFVDMRAPFDGRFRFGLLAHIYLFLAGIVTADICRAHDPLARPATRSFDLIFVGGLCLIYLSGLWLTHVDTKSGGGLKDVLSDLILLSAVLAIFFGAMRGRFGRKIMGHPWICLMGAMCFSIYLIHIVAVQGITSIVLNRLPFHNVGAIYVTFLFVLTVSSLLVGFLFFICIERPFMTGYRPRTVSAKHVLNGPENVKRENV